MKRYPLFLVFSLVGVLAYVISAQTKNESSGKTTAFTNVRVIDGTGKPAAESVTLVVRGSRIEAVQPSSASLPEGSEVIDASGKTIMPALIAAHSHLGMIKGDKAASANVTEENVTRQLKQYAAYGIGTVTSLGADGSFIYKLRENQNQNSGTGPRILTAGLGFGVAGGAPPAASGLDQVHRPESPEEAKAQVAELAKLKPDFVKIWIDDFNGTMPIKMDRQIRRTIIEEAHKHQLRVAAHVYYLSDAKELVRDGIDVIAHSIRDLPVDDELIDLMKKQGTSYIATLFLDEAFFAYAGEPEWTKDEFFKKALEPGAEKLIAPDVFKPKEGAEHVLKRASENLKRLHEAGIKIGIGTDSGANPYRVQGFAEHRELQLTVAAGLSPMDTIVSATRSSAELLGIQNHTGTLEPGKAADFLVLNENPLEDISNTTRIHQIWLGGIQQK